jgi:heterodisulfide reductase subunit C
VATIQKGQINRRHGLWPTEIQPARVEAMENARANKPNPDLRKAVERACGAEAAMCWTCSSCDSECPVEIATNRLRPQRIVRYANLGLFDELIRMPEIWYCLTCRRCTAVCPNRVKPDTLIRYARMAAIRCGVVSHEKASAYFELFRRFQKARWHSVERMLRGGNGRITDDQWRAWLDTPVPEPRTPIPAARILKAGPDFRAAVSNSDASACYACGGCSSVCPVAGERGAFDPRFVFRMVNLGLEEELLSSPAIWLCVQCGRCTDVCGQGVDGCGMIASLRELAIREAASGEDFPLRIREAQKPVYNRFVDAVDALLDFKGAARQTEIIGCLPAALYA